MIQNLVTQEQIDEINNDLKEIYKEMYIPMVNRYPKQFVSAGGNTKTVVTFTIPKVDLSHTQVDIESVYYNTKSDDTGIDCPMNQGSQMNIKSVSNSEINTIVEVVAQNASSITCSMHCTIRVTEWKKPTE